MSFFSTAWLAVKRKMLVDLRRSKALCHFLGSSCVTVIAEKFQKIGLPEKQAYKVGGAVVGLGGLGIVAGGVLTAFFGVISLLTMIFAETHADIAVSAVVMNIVGGVISLDLGFGLMNAARKTGFGSASDYAFIPALHDEPVFTEKSTFNAEATSTENFNTVASASAGPSAEVAEPANKIKTPGAKLSTPKPPSR